MQPSSLRSMASRSRFQALNQAMTKAGEVEPKPPVFTQGFVMDEESTIENLLENLNIFSQQEAIEIIRKLNVTTLLAAYHAGPYWLHLVELAESRCMFSLAQEISDIIARIPVEIFSKIVPNPVLYACQYGLISWLDAIFKSDCRSALIHTFLSDKESLNSFLFDKEMPGLMKILHGIACYGEKKYRQIFLRILAIITKDAKAELNLDAHMKKAINRKDEKGRSVFTWAVIYGFYDIAETLMNLTSAQTIHSTDSRGKNAAYYATLNKKKTAELENQARENDATEEKSPLPEKQPHDKIDELIRKIWAKTPAQKLNTISK